MKVGNLIIIPRGNEEGAKKVYYIVTKQFNNTAGLPYNWLVFPITSHTTVGLHNLVKVTHPSLVRTSYAKLNNVTTIGHIDVIIDPILFDPSIINAVNEAYKNTL